MAPQRLALRTSIAICAGTALLISTGRSHAADSSVSFARDVKPLLARRCFSCHGPTTHEGGLRLDKAEVALSKLESGQRAIVPGHVQESELVERVGASDPGERMPPEGKP